MKPTQITELFANIRKTIVSFFSIMMFVAMGVGIFCGILWSGPALKNAADSLFNDWGLHNYQIQFSYGLTDGDIAKVAEVEGVDKVEGTRFAIQRVTLPFGEKVVKIQSMGSSLDMPQVLEGSLPSGNGQIAIRQSMAEEWGLKVGDTLTFVHDNDGDDASDSASDDKDGGSKPDDADGGSESDDKEKGSSDDEGGSESEEDKDGMKLLTQDAFQIVGLVESAEYIAVGEESNGYSGEGSGKIACIFWTVPEAFDASAYRDGYPAVNVSAAPLAGLNTFGDAYKRASADVASRISDIGVGLAQERFEKIRSDAEQDIADAEDKVADAEKKISDAEKDVADGEQQVADGEQKIEEANQQIAEAEADVAEGEAKVADGRKKLKSGQKKYDKAKREFDKKSAAAQKKLDAAKEKLDEAQGRYDEAAAKVDKAKAKLKADKAELKKQEKLAKSKDPKVAAKAMKQVAKLQMMIPQEEQQIKAADKELAAGKRELDKKKGEYNEAKAKFDKETASARKELNAADKKLKKARHKINSAQAHIDEAKGQIEDGKRQIEEKTQEIEDAKKDIAQAKEDIADGKQELAEKKADLADAKHEVESMKSSSWTVAERAQNMGVSSVNLYSGVTDRLSFTMAALFIIVGLLVTYSAVSRIVHEQITQIGTKKALGFRSREITMSFLAYAAGAVIIGAIIGLLVGVFVVEGILAYATGASFIFGWHRPYVDPLVAIGVTALELVLVLLATWLACRSILAEQAVELLKGEKPPEAKARFYEKWAIWERLPLFTQTIVNNCVNDKRRVFSTIVGVAGCTALVVTAITLNDDVLASFDKQYENVYGFTAYEYVDTGVDGAMEEAVKAAGELGVAACAPAFSQVFEMKLPTGENTGLFLVVPRDEASFSQVYHVNVREGAPFDPTAEGLWISEAYASHMGAKVGDTVTIRGADSTDVQVPILGFYEYYLTSYEAVMGPAAYASAFDTDYEANALLVDPGDVSFEDLSEALSGLDGHMEIVDEKAVEGENFDSFADVSRTVVLVYLVLAVLMATVVLLNLFVMFIEEKKRELIVLRINGFSVGEAKKYIYNDTIFLTLLGIAAGLALGIVMGTVTVASVEPDTASLFKGIDPRAVIAGIGSSAVLATVMSIISLRRIPAFSLTDIDKV